LPRRPSSASWCVNASSLNSFNMPLGRKDTGLGPKMNVILL
jgi:hypothetical protein